jgi:hypothetical protein
MKDKLEACIENYRAKLSFKPGDKQEISQSEAA